MNRKMDYNEICRSLIKDKITSNHSVMKLSNNNLLQVNIRNGSNEMYLELGLSLNYGTFMRLKSGLAHLIEHLISNKINEKIKDIDGRVISRTHLDTMILGLSVPYLNSKYIENDNIAIVDLFTIMTDSIKEACNIDYIKENLENEINIIKSELKMSENDPAELFRNEFVGYLSKDSFIIDSNVGGRSDKMDKLNNPEMVKDAMEFLLSSNPRFNLGIPEADMMNSLRFFSYYNYCICDEYGYFLNLVTVANTDIFEEDFFKPNYNRIKEIKEGNLNVVEIESSDPDNLPKYLVLNPGEIKTKEDWIRITILNNLLNNIILCDSSSMIWKELREKGETYGIYSDLSIYDKTPFENEYDKTFYFNSIELWDREMHEKIFGLIKNKVHLEYIDREFENAKKSVIKMFLTYSSAFNTLDYSKIDYGVSFDELINTTRTFSKHEFISFVEYILDESNCVLIVPVEEYNYTI